MWRTILCAALVTFPVLRADERNIDYDRNVDFSKFRTFSVQPGKLTSKRPELNSSLVARRIEGAVKDYLSSKGLEESPRADIVITYHLGSADKTQVQSWPAGRFGWHTRYSTYRFTEGTLVLDVLSTTDRELVWRGVYTDEESDAAKLSRKVEENVKKLLEKYPPGKE